VVFSMDGYMLHLVFSNGEERVFDAKPLLSIAAYRPLQDKRIFDAAKAAYGSMVWPRGIDYCPDTPYAESMALEEWGSG